MFKDLVIANRSSRGYDPNRKVTKEELTEMVDCARLSAASINIQPLKYFLVYDEEGAKLMNSLVKFGANLPELGLPFEGTEPPAFILICHDTEIHADPNRFMKDIGICAQSITLAATEMGLNACMIGNYNKLEVRKTMNIDERYTVELAISVGKNIEDIRIVDLEEGDSFKYYRDEDGVHYVPKRKLEDVIISK